MADIAAAASRTRSRLTLPLAAGLGAAAALGQAPVSLPWATLAALAALFALFSRAGGVRRAAWIGWAAGAGYFAAALFWIVEPFLVDLPRHGWMAPFALVFTAGGFALFWGAAFALAARLRTGPWAAALAWAGSMALAELARSYLLTGFPWALLGHAWVGWAPMQLAAWIGPQGLTLLTLLAPALAVAAWPRPARLMLVLLPFALAYGAGLWRQAQPVPADAQAPVVRLVQPNAPQHLKWDPAHATEFFRRQLEYTAAGADGRPDLVVWPETAIPGVLHRADRLLASVATAAGGVPVVLGIQRVDEEGRAFNSLIVLDEDGAVADIYDKHHLVPFGEYLPLARWIGAVGLTLFGVDAGLGYSPGPGARLVDLGAAGRALPLICYEAIFPQDVRAAPERPRWLLQITNDAWFGQVAGPYQHLAQARLRAVEQGLPLLRAANTGVSAVIDARGRVLAQIPLGRADWIEAPLPPTLPPTLYARTGDWPVTGLLLAALLALWLRRSRKPIDAAATDR